MQDSKGNSKILDYGSLIFPLFDQKTGKPKLGEFEETIYDLPLLTN